MLVKIVKQSIAKRHRNADDNDLQINSDNKITAVDARKVLRVATRLDSFDN